jgi:hypothetical protein
MSTSFFGREEELARLQRLFELAAERDSKGRSVHGPRMALIVAHTGVGKTRLARSCIGGLLCIPFGTLRTSGLTTLDRKRTVCGPTL